MNSSLYIKAVACAVAMGFLPAHAASETSKQNISNIEQHITSYSVGLGVTRLIYNPNSMGATLSINNPNDFPVLAQTTITSENRKGDAPFIVTPPLFRLDGKQQSRLKVVMTGEVSAKDRETLYWLCATGIPPEKGDEWAKGEREAKPKEALLDVKVKLSQCVKLMVRPSDVKDKPENVAAQLKWTRNGDVLKGQNPTPFYMNLSTLSVAGKIIGAPAYIPPFGTTNYVLPKGSAASGKVSWKILNDFGGESGPFEAALQ